MFTGIIEEIGIVNEFDGSSLSIKCTECLLELSLGDSIAVNGACLTVSSIGKDYFSVQTMPETIRRTNFSSLQTGSTVNLERALTYNGRIGGHITQGHVDMIGIVESIYPDDQATIVHVNAPHEVMRYLVYKGYIAVNGISLTVISCEESGFSVSVVEYTMKNTNLGNIKVGDTVNLEIDIMAKYVEQLLSSRESPS